MDVLENFLSRCSKLFYTISRCYFYIGSTFSGASISFVFSHIARYVPSPEENSCIPITHFQCKNNFEHLLIIHIHCHGMIPIPHKYLHCLNPLNQHNCRVLILLESGLQTISYSTYLMLQNLQYHHH